MNPRARSGCQSNAMSTGEALNAEGGDAQLIVVVVTPAGDLAASVHDTHVAGAHGNALPQQLTSPRWGLGASSRTQPWAAPTTRWRSFGADALTSGVSDITLAATDISELCAFLVEARVAVDA